MSTKAARFHRRDLAASPEKSGEVGQSKGGVAK
jgi:hypothetical protein